MEITEEQIEQIGKLADRCENLIEASKLPLPAAFHVEQLRESLGTMAEEIRAWYVAVNGTNPWAEGGIA